MASEMSRELLDQKKPYTSPQASDETEKIVARKSRPQKWTCENCGNGFSEKYNLKRHQDHSCTNLAPRFTCPLCDKCFPTEDAIVFHIFNYHEWSKSCKRCSAHLVGRNNYSRHMKTVHDVKYGKKKKEHISEKVQEPNQGDSQWKHLDQNDSLNSQKCNYCLRYFKMISDHMKSQHLIRLKSHQIAGKCSYCPGVFQKPTDLENHTQMHHMELQCLVCGSICSGAFGMSAHAEEAHLVGGLTCVCNDSFLDHQLTLDHFLHCHVAQRGIVAFDQEIFYCEFCRAPFQTWQSMHDHIIERHEITYIAVQDESIPDELVLIVCPYCHDFFHLQQELDAHISARHTPIALKTAITRRIGKKKKATTAQLKKRAMKKKTKQIANSSRRKRKIKKTGRKSKPSRKNSSGKTPNMQSNKSVEGKSGSRKRGWPSCQNKVIEISASLIHHKEAKPKHGEENRNGVAASSSNYNDTNFLRPNLPFYVLEDGQSQVESQVELTTEIVMTDNDVNAASGEEACHSPFQSVLLLGAHVSEQHTICDQEETRPGEPVLMTCPYCYDNFQSQQDLDAHITADHQSAPATAAGIDKNVGKKKRAIPKKKGAKNRLKRHILNSGSDEEILPASKSREVPAMQNMLISLSSNDDTMHKREEDSNCDAASKPPIAMDFAIRRQKKHSDSEEVDEVTQEDCQVAATNGTIYEATIFNDCLEAGKNHYMPPEITQTVDVTANEKDSLQNEAQRFRKKLRKRRRNIEANLDDLLSSDEEVMDNSTDILATFSAHLTTPVNSKRMKPKKSYPNTVDQPNHKRSRKAKLSATSQKLRKERKEGLELIDLVSSDEENKPITLFRKKRKCAEDFANDFDFLHASDDEVVPNPKRRFFGETH